MDDLIDSPDRARDDGSAEIGVRARKIRQRRGMSLDTAAGLAGISKGQLSKLERGRAAFTKRGLIEDLALAIGCSVADLTGQPYLAPDRLSAEVAGMIPALSLAIHDATLDDAPDIPARELSALVRAARSANQNADNVRYSVAGRHLAQIIAELQVHVVSGDIDDSRTALAALVEACMAAQGMARTMGHADLALSIARRGFDAARRLERHDLAGLTAMNRGYALMRIGARHRAAAVLDAELQDASDLPGPSRDDTRAAEARGMLHLTSAMRVIQLLR